MLRLLIGVVVGVLLWSAPDAKRIAVMVLRSTADYLDPEKADSTTGIELKSPPLSLPEN